MPYAQRKYRIKRPYRKRAKRPATSWYNRKYSVRQLASYAAKGVSKIYGLVNSEMYKLDIAYASTSIGAAGVVAPMSGVAQGDGASARTGNSILVRALNVKGALTWNTSSSYQSVSILLVQDTQQIYDTPSPTIAGGDLGVLTTYSPWSHLNPNTVGRYKILSRKTYSLSSQNPLRNFEINCPMMHHVRYNGVNANDIAKGGLSLIFVCSDSLNPSSFTLNARLSYRDN